MLPVSTERADETKSAMKARITFQTQQMYLVLVQTTDAQNQGIVLTRGLKASIVLTNSFSRDARLSSGSRFGAPAFGSKCGMCMRPSSSANSVSPAWARC